MGFFSKILGGGKEYPPLEEGHPVAAPIGQAKPVLEKLSQDVPDSLEIVPAGETVYVFAGKPPKQFGMFWVQGGRLHNFKTLSREKGLSSLDLQPVVEKLQAAYREHDSESRYSMHLGDRAIVVTPSEPLAGKVDQIIRQVAG